MQAGEQRAPCGPQPPARRRAKVARALTSGVAGLLLVCTGGTRAGDGERAGNQHPAATTRAATTTRSSGPAYRLKLWRPSGPSRAAAARSKAAPDGALRAALVQGRALAGVEPIDGRDVAAALRLTKRDAAPARGQGPDVALDRLPWRHAGAHAEFSWRLERFSTGVKTRLFGEEVADNLEFDVDSSPEIRFHWEFD